MLDFDPSQCPRVVSSWTSLTYRVSQLLTKPLPTTVKWAIIIAGLVLIVLGLRYGYQRRPKLTIGVMLGLFAVFSPVSINLALRGLTLPIPPDPGTPVDAIVFVGRPYRLDNGARLRVAEQLWRDRRAPLIFSSGAGRLIERIGDRGVPEAALRAEICSLTTNENALYTARYLKPDGIETILLVTDEPHMWRSLLTFESQGFDVIPHATPLADTLGYRDRLVLAFREYAGLLSYTVLGRFDSSS